MKVGTKVGLLVMGGATLSGVVSWTLARREGRSQTPREISGYLITFTVGFLRTLIK